MNRMENGIYGIILLSVGLVFLWKWRKGITKEEIDSTNYLSRNQSPEEFRTSLVYFNLVILLVGLALSLGALFMLFSAITGLDWPFHYR
jgi:hypothetical protein